MATTTINVDDLIATLEKYPYLCSFGDSSLGPLNGPPTIEPEVETEDVTLYETGAEVQAQYLKKFEYKVTIKTRNVALAMGLLTNFKKGDNLLDAANKKSLTLVPITSASDAKTITFTDAYLQADSAPAFGENEEPNEVDLVFLCKSNAATGKPFTYGS